MSSDRGPEGSAAGAGPRLVRTAVFVDFDNIYLGLERQSPEAARQFATNPQRWMGWLRRQVIESDPTYDNVYRRFLVRRCYLNPNSFSRFRADFTRSAFQVIDCPPLTAGGKTSADIHMVLDVLDTLQQETRVDEFMILSADADFTPVLSRLSRHDRRSIVLAVGPASATYRATCDLLLDQDEFIDQLLPDGNSGHGHAGPADHGRQPPAAYHASASQPVATHFDSDDDLFRAMADRVRQAVDEYGDVPARELPRLYRAFPEFAQSTDWLGHFGLRRLTGHIASQRPDLTIEESPDDPSLWSVVARAPVARQPVSAAAVPVSTSPAASLQLSGDVAALGGEVIEFLSRMVADAPRPVAVATAATRVKQRFGTAAIGNWLGFGRFEEMLRRLPPGTFRVSDHHPRHLYDPARHDAPEPGERPADEMAAKHPELAQLAWRIHQITDVPYLTPDRFASVFEEIAAEVGANGYDVMQTSRVVRDRLNEAGRPVPRVGVTFVLRGLAYALPDFDAHPHAAAELAAAFRDNVLGMCRNARLELGDEEKRLVDRWLVGMAEPS